MAHIVTCTECFKKFDRDAEPFVEDRTRAARYLHYECNEKRRSKLTQQERDYEDLEDYIKKLFGKDYLTKKIINQIHEYRKTYNYSYSGMFKTLFWWFDINKNSIKNANGGIGIIPFVYDQAKEYYERIYQAQLINTQAEIASYQNKIKEIEIAPPRARRNMKKLFNLDGEETNE